ncbi:MAG: aquaporin family protein [Acidimicrobiia bacterium]|nr:aquaporin family protein [Acidimicrobiia bacterium]
MEDDADAGTDRSALRLIAGKPGKERCVDNIFVAEMIGTAILILLGDGVVANVLLKDSKGEGAGWIVITAGWAFAVAIGVYAAGVFSGAHINPAVTLGFAVGDITPWGDVPAYLAGQFSGAFLGACLVYLAYLNHWEPTEDSGLKLAVFSTGPARRDIAPNFITEVIGTMMLVIGVLAIVGTTAIAGEGLGTGLNPLLIGLLVWGIGLSLGGPTGYAINPARDLGPRIAHAVLPIPGKGDSDWEYAWIPVVAPIVGGIIGVLIWNGVT